MNKLILDAICDGDLDELKKIPKINITEEFSKNLLLLMEERIKCIIDMINTNNESREIMHIACYYQSKKKDIEKCILYLKKIK